MQPLRASIIYQLLPILLHVCCSNTGRAFRLIGRSSCQQPWFRTAEQANEAIVWILRHTGILYTTPCLDALLT
ncbi:hypothetical protein ACQKWADRAFT_285918, partial [Trichoderma austrokoningii]